MLGLILVVSVLAAANGETCIPDDRATAISASELLGRRDITKLSKDGMWKMAQLARQTPEEVLEDCGSCGEAEVGAEFPFAGMTNLTDVFYPFPTGLSELKRNVKTNLELRTMAKVEGFKAWDHTDAKSFAKNQDHVKQVSPLGLGKIFEMIHKEDAQQSKYQSSSTMKLAEFGTHSHLLRSIQSKTSQDGLALILRDGTMVEHDFSEKLNELIGRVPKDFDLITLHDEGSSAVRCEDRVADKVYEMRRPIRTPDGKGEFYRGVEAYIVRKQSIPKIIKEWQMLKADSLETMMMSVHSESTEKKSGLTFYQSSGIYSYTACGCGLIHRFEGNTKPAFLQK